MVPLLILLAAFSSSSALGAIHERFEDLPIQDFNYIIVGGGTAGNVLANRLTEDPHISLLVLEAGTSTADVILSEIPFFCSDVVPGTPWDWNFTTTEQPGLKGRSVRLPRGFGLGGSSAVNGMAYTRDSSQDYDRYAQVSGDDTWGWDALQLYFRKNERFVGPADNHNTTGQFDPAAHGFDGINPVSMPGYPRGTDSHVIQTTAELPDDFPFNLDYNSGYHLGVGWTPVTVGNGTRSSSQTSYLAPEYIERPNLHVLIHTHVTRILRSTKEYLGGSPIFNAVEFTQDAGASIHTLAPPSLKEIVLSAGSIGTPHILLHSGIGDSIELAALGISPTVHLPDVGKNLTDHPGYNILFSVNSTNTIENVYLRNATFQREALAEWRASQTGYLTAGIANQMGFLRVPEDTGVVEGEPCAGNETAHYELIFINGDFWEPVPETGNFFRISTIVLCPLSRGTVTINSTNPLDPPLINPNYLTHPQDLSIMQYALASAQNFVTAPVWDGYILDILTNTTVDDIRNGSYSVDHPVGTASMSPAGADWGVVDPDLKLKGAKGVRIVDASVMPFVPAGHTQAAVYVIAERAVDLIKSEMLGAIYERLEELPTLDFDFIIVGGGTAGNVIANRLTEDPQVSVLVLEAGASTADVLLSQVPFFFPRIVPGTVWDWNFTTTEQPGLNGRSVPLPRGFGLGGSSAVNAMFYTRGSSQDYDRYAQISGDPGWGWEALQPYFRKNERFVAPADHHNTTGQFNPASHGFRGVTDVSLPGYPRGTDSLIIQTTTELPEDFPFNLDYNSGYHLGIGWAPLTVGNGTRSSSQTSYLGPGYIDRPNLHVLVQAHVTRILRSDNKNINGLPTFNAVEFTQDAGVTKHTLAPTSLKEIVLSAGSIGTPHILLHSGIGDAGELAALHITPTLHLPDVGKNFTDHPIWSMLFTVSDTDTIENIYFRNATFQADALAEWQATRTGFLTVAAANQLAFLRIPDGAGIVEGEPCAGNETAHYEMILSACTTLDQVKFWFLTLLQNGVFRDPIPETGNFFSVRPAVMCPLSRGNVTINSTNPLDPPLINPNFLSHSQDLAIMKYAIASAQKLVTAPVWDGYILDIVTNTTEDDIRNGVASLFHPVGSASMSPANADWGVVDPHLKLKGAKGVRIVDASVLPFLPAAHTQVPVYVFAERAADLIKEDRY
ncbi:uncharacterized protein EV420DRAFT_1641064 [Desarmillaria tabescens]|uniref:Glucose-methanol-choline oxidoreductase N-terminal domain-containing protein n=1 Tax=Armillaria tabescens TaxID=1929756 RepID=A0AA39N7M2_ARMTA|nr:uncharacterized protein EV420DRAFT_1641064 [Desarmillaria tabescens]KAK0460516.1 hypothetical protein EV420DRAFT_1641064 [Desarmillaria tabescens]